MKTGIIRQQIRAKAIRAALVVIEAAYNSLQNQTPVITGETRASWFVDVDGTRYYHVPTEQELMEAKRIQIRNDEGHIGELDGRYAIMDITAMKVGDVINRINRRT